MRALTFFAASTQIKFIGVNLVAGICLLPGLPAMANSTVSPIQRLNGATLIAQDNLLDLSLRQGSEGERVIELQRALQDLRLFDGEVTGFFGDQTRHSVRQFQRIRRLEVTGVADFNTLDQLGLSPTAVIPVMIHPIHGGISTDRLERGDRSSDVRALQYVLNSFGFGVGADGVYGQRTEDAVRAYQTTARLRPNGVANRRTLEHMGFEQGRDIAASLDIVESQPSGGTAEEGRYIAAVIASPSDLWEVRRDFPDAEVATTREGEYISLGRYLDRSTADAAVDYADSLGYDSRVLWD